MEMSGCQPAEESVAPIALPLARVGTLSQEPDCACRRTFMESAELVSIEL